MIGRGATVRVSGPSGRASDLGAAPRQPGAEVSDRLRAAHNGFSTERLQRRLVLELAGNVAGRTVLDVGCGDGELALVLARLGADVTGIDSSAAMIATARQRTRHRGVEVVFERGEAEWLPFHPEEFDVVTAVAVVGLVANARGVLEEIVRALKPGGRLVIGEFGTWRAQAAGRRMPAWRALPLRRHAQSSTTGEIRKLVEEAGCIIETVRGVLCHPCGTGTAGWRSIADSRVRRFTPPGATFVALSACKPGKSVGKGLGDRAADSSAWLNGMNA